MAKAWGNSLWLSRAAGLVISIGLLVGVGFVGVYINSANSRTVEEARRTVAARAVTTAAGSLRTGLTTFSGMLVDFVEDHDLQLTRNNPADAAALQTLLDSTPFYAVSTNDARSEYLTKLATAPLPDEVDPGYFAMVQTTTIPPRPGRLAGTQGLLSSVMSAGDEPVIAVGVIVFSPDSGIALGAVIGHLKLRDPRVRKILFGSDRDPLSALTVVDRSGRVAGATDLADVGTLLNPDLFDAVDKASTSPLALNRTVAGRPGMVFAVGDVPGDWKVVGGITDSALYDKVRQKALLVNLALGLIVVLSGLVLVVTGVRADRRIRRHQARFRALVQNSSDMIVVLDPGGRLLYASPSTAGLTGRSPDGRAPDGRAPGGDVLDHVHPEDRAVVRAVFVAAQADPGAVHRAEFRVRRDDGAELWLDASVTDLRSSAAGGVVINARDVTDNRALRERLHEQATVDALTGLGNRRRLYHDLAGAIASGRSPAVLFIDLDRFKPVNDRLGHEAGDELLRLVGARLSRCLRPGDSISRAGGDEFVIVAPGLDAADAEGLAARVVATLGEPFSLSADPAVRIGGSVGIELAGPADLPDEVLRRADGAMYRAKQVRGTYAVTGSR